MPHNPNIENVPADVRWRIHIVRDNSSTLYLRLNADWTSLTDRLEEAHIFDDLENALSMTRWPGIYKGVNGQLLAWATICVVPFRPGETERVVEARRTHDVPGRGRGVEHEVQS